MSYSIIGIREENRKKDMIEANNAAVKDEEAAVDSAAAAEGVTLEMVKVGSSNEDETANASVDAANSAQNPSDVV